MSRVRGVHCVDYGTSIATRGTNAGSFSVAIWALFDKKAFIDAKIYEVAALESLQEVRGIGHALYEGDGVVVKV